MASKKNTASVLSDADAQHKQRLEAYAKQVDKLYKSAVKEISQLATKVGAIPQNDQFSFAHNPGIEADVDKVIQKLSSKIQALIETGDREQWMAACKKSNAFIASLMNTSAIPKDVLKTYQDRNLEALSAFQERKINGMNLSERVWKHVSPLKQEVETIVDTTARYSQNGINAPQNLQKIEEAIGNGISADELSREVRSCLKEPNKLFRRIRDKYGNLHLSQNAKLYHPGQGVYRSSYKNAKRMTRSEINMAYRQSDYLRWQQLDFVVGQRVQLSGNHTCLGKDGKSHPFYDICDILAGDYPKDAKLVGWHPQCRCIITPIMKPYEEWQDDRKHIDEKAYRQLPASNEVSTTPAAFRTYIQENYKRIAGWKSTPYYIKDNPHYVANAIDPTKYPINRLALQDDVRQQLTEYRTYAYTHQGSEKFGKAIDAALMAQMTGDQKAFDDAMDLMAFTKKTNERIQAYTAKKKAEKAKAKLQDPAELRHKYDAQIDVLRQNAAKYKLDMTGIDEAYTSLNMAKIEAAIKEQQDILDFKVAKMEKIYAAAEKRHAARTPEKEKALKDFAAQHKEKTEKAYKEFDDIIKEASGITEADVSTLRNLKTGKAGTTPTKAGEKVNATLERMQEEAQKLKKITEEYNSAMNEAKALVSELKGIKDVDTDSVLKATSIKKAKEGVKVLHDVKDKIEDLTYLDNPLQAAKDFSLADAIVTNNVVKDKITKDWYGLSDEALVKKLDFEAYTFLGGNMKNVQSKYKTWQVSQNAYIKKLKEVKEKIWLKESQATVDEMFEFYKKNLKYPSLHKQWAAADDAIIAKDHDAFNKAVEAFNKKKSEIQAKAAGKNAIKFKEVDDDTCMKLIEEFKADDTESADKYLRPILKTAWAGLTEEQRIILTKYTQTYEYLNKPLRNLVYSGWRSSAEAKKDLVALTEALSLQKTKKNMVVRRGTGDYPIAELGIHSLGELKPGQEFTDGAFLSTAVQKDCGFGGSYELVIVVPKGAQGTYAEPFSHYTGYGPNGNKYDYESEIWDGNFDANMKEGNDEREWIGQRGSRFKVIKVDGDTIYLKMIGQMYDQPKDKI